jgi:hypothetical protein
MKPLQLDISYMLIVHHELPEQSQFLQEKTPPLLRGLSLGVEQMCYADDKISAKPVVS